MEVPEFLMEGTSNANFMPSLGLPGLPVLPTQGLQLGDPWGQEHSRKRKKEKKKKKKHKHKKEDRKEEGDSLSRLSSGGSSSGSSPTSPAGGPEIQF